MYKNYFGKYYKLMGCITMLISLAIIIGLIITVVNQFQTNAGAWPITASFLNMLATLVMGSGIANLFFAQGCNVSDQNKDSCKY